MPKVNELTVRCENRPGMLTHIATLMGDANVGDYRLDRYYALQRGILRRDRRRRGAVRAI